MHLWYVMIYQKIFANDHYDTKFKMLSFAQIMYNTQDFIENQQGHSQGRSSCYSCYSFGRTTVLLD